MTKARKLKACDLFCGAGGTTTGAVMSGHVDVVLAINHWRVAVSSHLQNHPDTRHICAEIDNVNPREFRDMGINLLLASPECVGHSNAKGDAPIDDQRRATAWCVPRWLEMLRPKYAVIENVREFQNWGPLIKKRDNSGKLMRDKKGRVRMIIDPHRKGEIFRAWLAAITGIGYQVELRLLNAADYGGAQKRLRLFILCRYGKSKKPMPWPVPTHTPEQYLTARNTVIDWNIKSRSIFARKIELVDKTIRRIEMGIRQFAKPLPEPFITANFGEREKQSPRAVDVDRPLPTVTSRGAGNLIEPFVMDLAHSNDSSARATPVDQPLNTITTKHTQTFVEPFLLPRQGLYDCRKDKPAASVDAPLNTVTAGHKPAAVVEPFLLNAQGPGYNDPNFKGVKSLDEPMPTAMARINHALVEPFVAKVRGSGVNNPTYTGVHDVDKPLPTVLGDKHHAVVEPFQLQMIGRGAGRVASVDEPTPTVIAARAVHGLVEPVIVAYHGGNKPGRDGTEASRMTSVDQPLPVVDTNPRYGLIEPTAFNVQYYGTGHADSVDEPLATVTTKDRHALVTAWYGQLLTGLRERYAERPAMLSLIDTMEEFGICDVHYRMLVNKELARAQGFPDDYLLMGKDWEITKQIGNAVHRNVAEAICRAIGEAETPKPRIKKSTRGRKSA